MIEGSSILSPDQRYIEEVVTYLATSAVVGDILGRTLNTYLPEHREYIVSKWITKSRGEFPQKAMYALGDDNIKHSATSETLLEVLEVLSVYSFTKSEEFETLGEEIEDYLATLLENKEFHSIIIGSAVAVGCYMATRFAFRDDWEQVLTFIVDTIYGIVSKEAAWEDSYNKSAFYLVSFTIMYLSKHGYFGHHCLQALLEKKFITGELQDKVLLLRERHLDKDFISLEDVPSDLMVNLTYFESMIITSLFYLCKVDAAWVGTKRARELLASIVREDLVGIHDQLFLFSSLSTASEHMYLLYSKPLRDNLAERKQLASLIQRKK